MKKLILTAALILGMAQVGWGQYAYIGYNTAGGSLVGGDLQGRTRVNTGNTTTSMRFAAQNGDIVDSLRFYGYSDDSNPESVAVAVYTVTSDQPDDMIFADTIETVAVGGGAWRSVNTNYTITSSATLVVGMAQTTSDYIELYYDAGSTDDAEYKVAHIPDPWGAAGTNETRKYSIVAVVDTSARSAGGGSTPTTAGGNVTAGASTQ